MSSYDKLKKQIFDLEREQQEMYDDMYKMLYGNQEQIKEVCTKWNFNFQLESMAGANNEDVFLPPNTIFIQPAERE